MSDQELDKIWETLPREEKLKVLEAHLDELVAKGELWAAEVDGEMRYFATRRHLLKSAV